MMDQARRTLRVAVLAAVAALAACAKASEPARPPSAAPSPRPSTTATLTIAAPETGAVIRDDRVDLVIELDGGRINEGASLELRPNEGHLHVLLDDRLISMTEGLHQVIRDVWPGSHRITVEFVASDHAPFDPRVVSVVAFEVRP